jgi:hypothetical protein
MTKKNAVEFWLLERLVPYGRNPRKNEGAVDRMVASIQEFGFKIPVLACSSGGMVICASKPLGSWVSPRSR